VAHVDAGGLHLVANDAGRWDRGLTATVVHPDPDDEATTAAANQQSSALQQVTPADLFNLTLAPEGGAEETHTFVTVVPGPRRVDAVLASSALAHVAQPLPTERPDAAAYPVDAADVTAGVDGDPPTAADYVGEDDEDGKTGMQALLTADLNILCIPPTTPAGDLPDAVWAEAAAFCTARRAFLVVDPPGAQTAATLPAWIAGPGGLTGSNMRNAAVYFPRIRRPDPLRGGSTATFAACGAIAGTYARTDGARGVWKAPAGIEAGLAGVVGLPVSLTDDENGVLNPLGINCLRTFRGVGSVVWGARTLRGSDVLADEYKYVPVRRLALFLEESIDRGTRWVVFEPNAEPLWAQLRRHVGAFLHDLFRQGAFEAASPRDAYFVACDATTTTPDDVASGVVNIRIGFAPSRPAEFVVLEIRQLAGRCEG
jgi:hypothetical protein